MLSWAIILLATATIAATNQNIGAYDPEYGMYIGELSNLSDGDVKGTVYVINETSIQLVNFTYNGNAPEVYFWMDLKDTPTEEGLKIPSFEFGITPLGPYKNAERVVLTLPGLHKINQYKSFSLYDLKYKHNFGSVVIPLGLNPPKPQFVASELKGNRYNVGAGPILIVDRRTIKVFAFTFDGDKAPDAYFFVGRGPNVDHKGVKVPIRGRDLPQEITSINERYRGGHDLIIELPEDHDVDHIDWLSIYCYKFHVDFGHISISNVSDRIPPFVPHQKRFDEMGPTVDAWVVPSLLGNEERRNFTFQLGHPGGKKGYKAMTYARPGKYVWYVNGMLADIYLLRGETYNFIIEGGSDKNVAEFYNPLYVTEDQYGGYSKLSAAEKEQVKFWSSEDFSTTAGRLCVWSNDDNVDADNFATFGEFRRFLTLKCETDKKPAVIQFTANTTSPKTLYFQSANSYNMGFKIHVVDELPTTITDIKEEPYQYEEWLQTQKNGDHVTASSNIPICVTIIVLRLVAFFF